MSEIIRTRYTRLFEVRLLHHFWLDDGAVVFDGIDADARARRLLAYDVRRVLAVEPSVQTRATIAGLRGVLRTSRIGLLVAVPTGVVVPPDVRFEFSLTPVDPAYASYTALTLRPQRISEVADPGDPRVTLRYKAGVPVLDNLTGAFRGAGASKRLFLSREYSVGATAGDGVESLVTSGSSLLELTGDPPAAPFHRLGATDEHPVYVHQDDVPVIVPPPGAADLPARGIELTPATPPSVCAVIRLAALRPDDDAFSLVTRNGALQRPGRVFEVHLRNRWTRWRYRDSADGTVASVTTDPLPLTRFGNAGVKQKPPTGAIDVEFDTGTPPKIVGLVSDVYV